MQEEMSDYFLALVRERRRAPREDLISALSKAEVDGERLSEYELVQFCKLLLGAGQETTKNLIVNAMVCLTDHPDAEDGQTESVAQLHKARRFVGGGRVDHAQGSPLDSDQGCDDAS